MFVALAVGMNNFGTGRYRTAELVTRLRNELGHDERVAGYGATGNLTMDGSADIGAVRHALARAADGMLWLVVRRDVVDTALAALDRWPARNTRADERLTPGLSFALNLPNGTDDVQSTHRAELSRFDAGVVLVCKHDALTPSGRLDSRRRHGGWGAISADVERQLGGRWTSRSAKTLRGLMMRSHASR